MADLIDRNKCIKDCLKFFPECSNVVDVVISKEPRVIAEPVVHAHWISFGFRCSNCMKFAREGGNYCPHCGAKMDEEVSYETD